MIPPRPGAGRVSELALRTASSVVLIAAALAAAYVGGLFFAAFWILAGVAVGVEWAWLIAGDPHSRRWTARVVAATLGVAGAALSLSIYLYVAPLTAALVLLAGAGAAALVARPAYFAAVAVPYGAAVFAGAMLLRRDPQDGLLAVLWLFAVVWSTDIAAFFAGRALGGPKLAPRLWPVAAVALVTSVVSQFGDLLESGVKRAYGAKDSSKLIPGHGGLMDRLDGFLFAATVAAAVGVARGGFEAAGGGLLRW